MKKFVTMLAVALVVAMMASIGSSAFYTGEFATEQREFVVPKVNPNNPAIVIDGKADLEGEWFGAVNAGVNLADGEAAEFAGFWDATVWGNPFSVSVESYDDIPEEHRNVWDTYYLWDEAGLYFAVVCETDTTPCPFNPAFYLGGDTTGQSRRVDGFTPMIRPCDDESVPTNWLEFWAGTLGGEDFWNDDSVVYYKGNPNNPYNIETASWRATEADENGAYPYCIEAFIPWDALRYGTGGAEKVFEDEIKAGSILMIGQIYLDGNGELDENGNPYDWGRGFDCPSWGYHNYYMLSATPAEQTDKVVEEEPEVTEPEVTEPEVTEPEVTEPEAEEEEETPAPSTTNPSTADVSVLFYALAAISAIGGISVFKRK
ncbi:MAG: hypothetical protein E7477_01875 [Ruminococcaceae bacterium]|nr:hypothetical protein [Oscillospiraceae bacterium]